MKPVREIPDWIVVAGPTRCDCGHLHYGRQDGWYPNRPPQWHFCEDRRCECASLKPLYIPDPPKPDPPKPNRSGSNNRQRKGQISVRLLPSEKDRATVLAAKLGVPVAQLARDALLAELDRAG